MDDKKRESNIFFKILVRPFKTRTFKDLIQRKQLNNDKYPYCETALTFLSKVKTFFVLILIIGIIKIISFLLKKLWLDEYLKKGVSTKIDLRQLNLGIIEYNMPKYIEKFDIGFNIILNLCLKFLIIGFLIFIILYLILLVKRQRLYERNILRNDLYALWLKNEYLKSYTIKERLKDAQRTLNKSNSLESGFLSKQAKVDSLKSLKDVKVFVNTRQSTEHNMIETQHRVVFKLPFVVESRKDMMGMAKELNHDLSALTKGKVVFGEYEKPETRDKIIFRSIEEFHDPYIYEIIDANETVILCQGNFPMGLVKDRQDEIDQNKEKAKNWAHQIQKKVTSYMATLDSTCKYVSKEVGNSSVSYKFQRQFDTKQSFNFESNGEQLGKNYNLGGVTMGIDDNGLLCVYVPLPKEMQVAINVPTMWREVYGDLDPNWPDNFLNKE